MGEEPCENYQLLSEPVIGMPGLASDAAKLATQHNLTRSAELELLIDHIFGLGLRGQGDRAPPNEMTKRRHQGFVLAKKIRDEAAHMAAAMRQLLDAYNNFHQFIGFDPAMLEAIFDADLKGSEVFELPAELNILLTAFYDERDDGLVSNFSTADKQAMSVDRQPADPMLPCPPYLWGSVDLRLQLLEQLPVKAALSRGPTGNLVLKKAVAKCRDFWKNHEGRRWSMSSLKNAVVRKDKKANFLQGPCEKFVEDILKTGGLSFTLVELFNAWTAVDSAERSKVSDNV